MFFGQTSADAKLFRNQEQRFLRDQFLINVFCGDNTPGCQAVLLEYLLFADYEGLLTVTIMQGACKL